MELVTASQSGNLPQVQALLAAGADVNATFGGCSPIYMAVSNGHLNVVRELISAGADVNVQTEQGVTPLNEVCRDNFQNDPIIKKSVIIEIIKLLLNAGADINKADNKGRTPIINAARSPFYERVKLLLESGANVNDAAKTGLTALMAAAFEGHINIVGALTNAGADVDKALIQDEVSDCGLLMGLAGDNALSITEKHGLGFENKYQISKIIYMSGPGIRIFAPSRRDMGGGYMIPLNWCF